MNAIGALAVEGRSFDFRENERLQKRTRAQALRGSEGLDQADEHSCRPSIDRETQEKIDVVKSAAHQELRLLRRLRRQHPRVRREHLRARRCQGARLTMPMRTGRSRMSARFRRIVQVVRSARTCGKYVSQGELKTLAPGRVASVSVPLPADQPAEIHIRRPRRFREWGRARAKSRRPGGRRRHGRGRRERGRSARPRGRGHVGRARDRSSAKNSSCRTSTPRGKPERRDRRAPLPRASGASDRTACVISSARSSNALKTS